MTGPVNSQNPAIYPNIVFIIADDLGWGDVGYHGGEIATPNIDEMASDGVRLNRNYVYPVCSPTRAALLTGRSAVEFGVDGPMADDSGLSLSVTLLPQYLRDLGYQTFIVGKWHLGIGNARFFPQSRGFDYFYGFLGGWVDSYTHVYNGGLDWQRNGESVRESGMVTDLLTADAIRLLERRDASRPFFLYLSYSSPHTPLQLPPTPSGLNSHIDREDRYVYAEMVTRMDAGIGMVLNALEGTNALDNTIVVFLSDNGGEIPFASNGSFRGSKGSVYEGGIRVPGLIWWPSRLSARTFRQPFLVYDWLPTLIEAIGGDTDAMPTTYGHNMWLAIRDGELVSREPALIGSARGDAVLHGAWKLVEWSSGQPGETSSLGKV